MKRKKGKAVAGKQAKLLGKTSDGVATFEYLVVQGVREENGREFPQAWDENPGFFLFRVEAKKKKTEASMQDDDDNMHDTVIFGEVDVPARGKQEEPRR